MNKQQRWEIILKACMEKPDVYVEEFVERAKCSVATIRRDLQEMEDLHMIVRFHGGARLNQEQKDELPMVFKSENNAKEKDRIARLAAHQIKNDQVVYLDAGSTTFEMLKYIHAKNITIVTIGVPHINHLMNRDIRTIVLGGLIRHSTQAITGVNVVKQLNDMFFDVAFIGTNGIDPKAGITTTNEEEGVVKHTVMRHSKQTFVLADSSKFDVIKPIKYADFSEVTIIGHQPDGFTAEGLQILDIDK